MPDSEVEQEEQDAGGARRLGGWAVFKQSPFFAATVLVFILAVAAGLFAGSYTYTLANPTPHHLPVAVVRAQQEVPGKEQLLLDGMNSALNGSLDVTEYDDPVRARDAVEAQQVFAIFDVSAGDPVILAVSSASGSTTAQALSTAAMKVGQRANVPVVINDINPLQSGDPRGLAIFYITLAAIIIGFVGAIQLNVHARALNPLERIGFTALYAVLGGLVINGVVDWWLGAVDLPFPESWFILSFTMFTSGMIFTMFSTLFGRWAMIPTWGLMVLLGNPSSGGAVSWPLLPSLLGSIGRWLPPGASVNAQHTAVYFAGHQHAFPFLVLAAWALVSSTVFWVWRGRHGGGRDENWRDLAQS